eukprot:TRINITY_DN2852_c3_g1_i1.p1 TRINITY_DN2852_c3_g1~~TRINITY_DN2852_c3_g1_i1.p1  ORF type:complete len:269 (+),score=87.10 TRINITY_DN2852_c3_g1_i1:79-807(+)
MKFGRTLREQSQDVFDDEVIHHLIDYKGLKKMIGRIRALADAGADCTAATRDWRERFDAELDKFETFFRERAERLRQQVSEAECGVAHCRGGQGARNRIKDLYSSVQELLFFADLNRSGSRKILKKFDKNMGTSLQAECMAETQQLAVAHPCDLAALRERLCRVHAELFFQGRESTAKMELDYHVVCVSDVLSHMLAHGRPPAAGALGDAARSAGSRSLPASPPQLLDEPSLCGDLGTFSLD